jgi:hypothetical protein
MKATHSKNEPVSSARLEGRLSAGRANSTSRRVEIALLLLTLFVISCGPNGHDGTGPSESPERPISSEPSRADLISAVRNHVSGKTYTKKATRYERRAHTCTQYDVDRDPYMPRNPELAKCPYVGKTYWTQDPVYVSETHNCGSLPADPAGWSVTPTGKDQWRVAYAASVWDLTKIEGEHAGAEAIVRVAAFAFIIRPHQDC